MSLTIKRAKDNRVVKCILHRIADIPGGVTVSVANLGGSSLFEGTPIGKGKNGAFEVCKTAQVITEADAAAKTYEVAKGHHFKVGDRFATADCNGQTITAIDKSNPAKDVITVGTTLGAVRHRRKQRGRGTGKQPFRFRLGSRRCKREQRANRECRNQGIHCVCFLCLTLKTYSICRNR